MASLKSKALKPASGYTLVLVESPAKAKTIEKYLGPGYKVAASYGHIRDLPSTASIHRSAQKHKKSKGALSKAEAAQARWVEKLGIDPFHAWKARYEVPLEKRKVVAQLKALSSEASAVYLATDPDREGEAIAWHLQEALGGDLARYQRIVFNSITRAAILKAVGNPGPLNLNFVHAQQTRRFLDRLVGFMVSPLLWSKVFRGLSAGRVQTPAVALIVERESEIQKFEPKAYQDIEAHLKALSNHAASFALKLVKVDKKSFKGENFEENRGLALELQSAQDWKVASVQTRVTRLGPPPPFTTSTLQQVASQRLRWSVKRVMGVAQKLYEHGAITYMRTDSVHVIPEALQEVREWIAGHYPSGYASESARVFKSGQRAQEAHEAIRPTKMAREAEEIEKRWGPDEAKLYRLIRGRLVASQMADVQFRQANVKVEACGGRFGFEYAGKEVQFEGWMKAFDAPQARLGKPLPDWIEQQPLRMEKLLCLDKTTHPPSRYTESKLVKELEKKGIGRPSTYAPILETIQTRGYVQLKSGHFYALRLGYLVIQRLVHSFEGLFSYAFTSEMEDGLDLIAHSKKDWKSTLDDFYARLSHQTQKAAAPESEGGLSPLKEVTCPSLPCRACHNALVLKCGPFGLFLQCSEYGKCCHLKSTALLGREAWPEEAAPKAEKLNFCSTPKCPACKGGMDLFALVGEPRALWVCQQVPDCSGHQSLQLAEPLWAQEESLNVTCMACSKGHYLKKLGRFGPYAICEACGDKKKWKNNQVVLTPSWRVEFPELLSEKYPGTWMVLREGEAGLFLSSNQFPKVRESRSPKILELQQALERLPEAWKRYAQAPAFDPEGRPTYLRFDRKLKKMMVGSKPDSFSKRWTAFVYHYSEPHAS